MSVLIKIYGSVYLKENILEQYGYDEEWKEAFSEFPSDCKPARVLSEHRSVYELVTEYGEVPGGLSGKYRFNLLAQYGAPTVGDFVAVRMSTLNDRAEIEGVLPRKTLFQRKDGFAATGIQLLAANFDTIFICMSLNQNYNLARLTRYLIVAKETGAEAVVVLTKSDLCADAFIKVIECETMTRADMVIEVSAKTGENIDKLAPYFNKGRTVIAVGSSGVGKSTLVNAVFGDEIMKTGEIREDDARGKHTTVHRQMILLPSGGIYIDTPGLREIGISEAEDAVSEMYADIEELMKQCKFADCRHGKEPGCAVKSAIKSGALTLKRYEDYQKYLREARYHENKQKFLQMRTERFKEITKTHRKNPKIKH